MSEGESSPSRLEHARPSISAVILDDDELSLAGMAALCDGLAGVTVAGRALSGSEGMTLIQELTPDVAIVDLLLDEPDGITIARCLAESKSPTRVILVADGPYPDWFQRALAVPVPGYLLRSSHPEELALSIHAVADGGFYYASAMQEYLLPDGPARPRPVQRNLSGEQWRILGLLVQGQTSKEIAKVVKKETRHVDRARQKILHRLGVPNTAALVAYAIQNELFLTARDGRRAPPNPATVDRPPDDGKAPGAKPRPKARARSHR